MVHKARCPLLIVPHGGDSMTARTFMLSIVAHLHQIRNKVADAAEGQAAHEITEFCLSVEQSMSAKSLQNHTLWWRIG